MSNITPIDEKENSQPVRVVGKSEANVAEVNAQNEILTYDVATNGGLDAILSIAPGVVIELKVGALPKTDRKYVQIQALQKDISWGFSATTQTFQAFKSQFFILPFGPGTSVYLKNNNATLTRTVAIAEIS